MSPFVIRLHSLKGVDCSGTVDEGCFLCHLFSDIIACSLFDLFATLLDGGAFAENLGKQIKRESPLALGLFSLF